MVEGWALDGSLALAWALPDERSDRADRFFLRALGQAETWVPALWWYEVSNALAVALRRQRLAEAQVARLERLFADLPIRTDPSPGARVFVRIGALARRHELSSYDASYLELAERKSLGLATLDARLMAAARTDGLRCWEAA